MAIAAPAADLALVEDDDLFLRIVGRRVIIDALCLNLVNHATTSDIQLHSGQSDDHSYVDGLGNGFMCIFQVAVELNTPSAAQHLHRH